MLTRLHIIFDRVKELQTSGNFAYSTGVIINQEFPDAYRGFFAILRADLRDLEDNDIHWPNRLEGVMQHDIVYKNLEKNKDSSIWSLVRKTLGR